MFMELIDTGFAVNLSSLFVNQVDVCFSLSRNTNRDHVFLDNLEDYEPRAISAFLDGR